MKFSSTKHGKKLAEERKLEARKGYETAETLAAEKEFAKTIAEKRKVKLHKFPPHSRMDYMITNNSNQGLALAELKCRKCSSSKYDTFMISLSKWEAGIRLSQSLGHPSGSTNLAFLIFVRWSDKDGYYKFDEQDAKHITTELGGRTVDQRDALDEEFCVYIPIHLFKDL